MNRWVLFFIIGLLVNSSLSSDAAGCPKDCICKDHISYVFMRCSTLTVEKINYGPVSHFEIAHSQLPVAIKEKAFVNMGLSEVNSISITNVSVTDLNLNAFRELKELTDVKISDTNISQLHPDIFQDNNKLRRLNLTNNPFEGIDYFIKSASVEELDMSNCNLTKIGPNTFQNLSQLTLLDLSSNNIKKLYPGTFDNLVDINEIRLSNNLLTEIPEDLFANNEELDSLYLDNNPLTHISGNMFSKLVVLSLHSCRLHSVPEGDFSLLEDLDLSNNMIEEMSELAFTNMPSLTNINIAGNNLKHVCSTLFQNNYKLEKIILDDNKNLAKLPEHGFKINNGSSFNVYWFSCQNCGLKSLSEKSFETMPAIVTLKLAHNSICDIRTAVFNKLFNLNELDLSYNQISTMDDNTFKHNINMNILTLTGNPLKTLHVSIFRHNRNLRDLDISNCGLFELWTSPKTEKLSSIQNLNVSNNRINLMTVEDVSVTDKLKSLDISGNDLKCTKGYKSLIEYLANNNIQDTEYKTHESLAYDFEQLAKDMVEWKVEGKKKCPMLDFELNKDKDIDAAKAEIGKDDAEAEIEDDEESDDYGDDDYDDDSDDDDNDDDDEDNDESEEWYDNKYNSVVTKPQVFEDPIATKVDKDGFSWAGYDTASLYLPSHPRKYSNMWPVLVFIGTGLAILGIVANIILCILRRRQNITVPRIINVRSMPKLKKNSGLVYQPLSEERDGLKTPVLGRFVPTVHNPNAPEHV